MTTETTEKDLVEEVEELLAKVTLPAEINNRAPELLIRLKDEVIRLRSLVRHMEFPRGE